MKKILLALLLVFIGLNASAGDSTGKALSVRTSLKSWLQSEGYAPKIDSDGDISFKYQGATYWIACENWRSQVYTTIFSQLDTEGASMSRLRLAADEAQREYKFVRLNVNKSNVTIAIAIPVQSSSEFTNFFSSFTDIISSAKKMCKDIYNQED